MRLSTRINFKHSVSAILGDETGNGYPTSSFGQKWLKSLVVDSSHREISLVGDYGR